MLENPGSNVNYNWSNGGGMGMSATFSGNSLSVGMNKIYITVTEVGGAGTSVIDSATINVVEPLIPAFITGVSSICKDSMRQLTASTPGGQWSSQNTSIAEVDGQGRIKGKAPGEVTIQYVINGAPCPDATSMKNITVNASPTPANINGSTTLCFNVPDTLTATVGGGSRSA
ncbi:MAG: Ig-like domain-containing protein [Saprospiraceae bacterium]|nr:Ig-like domain-containing protein [Saprospiraceae bacterium]